MSTHRSRRARTGRRPVPIRALVRALVMGLVMGLGFLATAGAIGAPAFASPTPSPTPPTDGGTVPEGGAAASQVPLDPLAVTINELTPSVLPTSGRLVVAGTVINRSESAWRELSVYLVVSGGPIATEEQLTQAVDSDPRTDVGDRIVDQGLYVDIPDLEPGERTGYRLSVPSTALGTNGQPGVYWLAVHVLGTSDEGRLEGADGRARTFLPFVPDGAGATELALGVQVREPVQRTSLGRLAQEERWTRSLGEEGALGRVVRLGARARDWPLTWVVDPAVVDAAVSLGRGNPPLDLAGEPESEGDADTGGEGEAEPEEEGSEPPGDDVDQRSVGARRAEEWVAQFSEQVRRRPVLAVPYADVDVPAAQAAGSTGLVASALAIGAELLAELDVTSTPVVAARDARVAPEVLDSVDRGVVALLAPEAVEVVDDAGPVARTEDGRRVVVADTVPRLAGPGPGGRDTALAVRQRLLADAALHALSTDRDRPLVRLLPRSWDPGARWADADFFAGLTLPWLTATSLGALATSAAPTGQARLTPVEEPDGEAEGSAQPLAATPLPPANFLAARRLIATGTQLDELLTVNDVFADEVTRQALTTVSRWTRERPWAAAAQARQARSRVEDWLAKVSVRSPSFVTMSSESGTFQVSLVNGLDQPVTVGLEATADGDDLQLDAPAPVEIPANGRGAMRIDAVAGDIGVHQVTLQPVSVDGTAVGEPSTLSVRSSKVGFILWVVMAVGGGLLFVAVTVRILRRIRQRRGQRRGLRLEPAPAQRGGR